MKIDSVGNVLIPPTKIVSNSPVFVSPSAGSTGLTQGALEGKLHLWFTAKRRIVNQNKPIYRAIIEKSTLRLVSMGQTPLSTSNSAYIPITQRKANNLLFLEVLTQFPPPVFEFIRYSVSQLGKSDIILPQDPACGGSCSFGISADGSFFFYSRLIGIQQNQTELILQPLNFNGRPIGSGQVVAKGREFSVLDLSRTLQRQRRYFLYIGRGLYLQQVDAHTGSRIGTRVKITDSVSTAQGGVIDPMGQFVVYADGLQNRYVMWYQALDGTGRPSGARREIASKVAGGLDILKD
jgi:hypothetical protein